MNVALHAQQTIPEGTEKIIIDGQTFYLHKVRKSEGLYRISVSYGVSQKEILEANPSAAFGLKEGQLIKIPVIKGRNSTTEQLSTEEYIYHTVEKGQTAYYISKRYRVDLQDIYDNNAGSQQQLVVGSIIKIPKKNVRNVCEKVTDDGFKVHKVESKETLYGLAKRYKLPIADIIKYNEGLESGVLSVGSFIRIPTQQKTTEHQEQKHSDGDNFEDANYYYHKIKAGETLYSISMQYHAKPEDVLAANGSVNADDLPLGYLVRIPKNGLGGEQSLASFEEGDLIEHKVKRKEQLADVAQKYGVPADIIEKVNFAAGIDLDNWGKGLVIKVPTKEWLAEYYGAQEQTELDEEVIGTAEVLPFEKVECYRYDYDLTKPTIKVAVMLPFNVEATKRINYYTKEAAGETVTVAKTHRKLSVRSKVFVEFYQGSLVALDALKKEGVNVNLFVYDTSPDTLKVSQILAKPELKHVDLIIGPAYSSNLKLVSDFSKMHKIPMVYPLSTSNQQMNNNPLLFQANPSDTLMFEIMSRQIIKSSQGKRIVMIRTKNADNGVEQRLSDLIRNKMYWDSFNNGQVPDFVEYTFKQDDMVGLERMLDVEKANTVIIPSIEEAQVNRIVTNLKGAVDKTKTDVTLWGLPDWLKYNTINPEDICKLNGHIFSYYGVNYADTISESRIKTYRRWFKTEPMAISPFFQTASAQSNMSRYSLWGHDVTYYFISAIRQFGKDFPHCIQHHNPHTVQSKLKFLRVANWGGFYNHGLYVLKFSPDYKVQIEEVQ